MIYNTVFATIYLQNAENAFSKPFSSIDEKHVKHMQKCAIYMHLHDIMKFSYF